MRLSSSSHQPAPSPSQTQSSRTANAPCFDNPGLFPLYFETGEVLVEDCAWVSESKTERCAFDGIIDQCPVSCDHCVRNDTLAPTMSSSPTAVPVPTTAHPSTHFSDSPSLSPTKTPNPTAQPTTAAQLAAPSWCRDSSEIFSVSDETGSFTCAWIAESKDDRCSSDEIRTRCPVACDFCLCTNFEGTFETISGEKDCAWVESNHARCYFMTQTRSHCPHICGECPYAIPSMSPTRITFSPTSSPKKSPTKSPKKSPTKSPTKAPTKAPTKSPTKIPTAVPTASPPVRTSSDIQIEMTSATGELMNEENILLLENTLNELLLKDEDILFNNIVCVVQNQEIKETSRKLFKKDRIMLQDTSEYILLVDINVSAEFQPIGEEGTLDAIATEEDAKVEERLEAYFSSEENSDAIITALRDDSTSASDYFSDINNVATIAASSTNDDQDSSDSTSGDNTLVISLSTASACVAIIVIVSLFIYKR